MPDLLTQALAFKGLAWVALAALVAGVVRGFSGFGTALIYLPVAAQVMPPVWAILSLAAMDVRIALANPHAATACFLAEATDARVCAKVEELFAQVR